MQKTYKKYALFFILPCLIAFTIAFIVPFFLGLYLSFCKFKTINSAKFVGLKNYVAVFRDLNGFIKSLWFTLKLSIVGVITANVFAFGYALLLTRGLIGTNAFRTILFMPNLVGGIVLGYIFQILINGILIGTVGKDITFSAKYGFWGLITLYNWQKDGYLMIIYIAGILAIPTDIIEAARIDGAAFWQTLRKIIIPLIMPSITICTFLSLKDCFLMYDANLSLTDGLPGNQTAMLAMDIFDTFYDRVGYYGVGQAKAVVFAAIIFVLVLLQLRLTRREEVDL